jgi:antitoxin YefM
MHAIAVKSAVVREKFSTYIDEVLHDRPKLVNRHRDHFLMMNMKHMSAIMEDVEMHTELEQDENGEFIATSVEINDIFATGETPEQAIHALAIDLIEYAYDYLGDSFQLYFNAPNRRGHFRYVLKIILSESPEAVVRLINADPERS